MNVSQQKEITKERNRIRREVVVLRHGILFRDEFFADDTPNYLKRFFADTFAFGGMSASEVYRQYQQSKEEEIVKIDRLAKEKIKNWKRRG